MSVAAALRTPFTLLVGLVATGVAATAVIVASLVRPRTRLTDRIARTWARIILWAGAVDLTVVGAEKVDPSLPYVVVSNHQSTFDIMCHFLALPVPIRFLAKQELFAVPLLGTALRRMGMVPVDRDAGRTIYEEVEERAAATIAAGNSIIVYPEGTRTRDGQLLPYKNGAFFIAIHTGLAVLPTTIAGSFEAWLPRAKVIRGGRVTVVIGEPIPTTDLTLRDAQSLRQRVRDDTERTLKELRSEAGRAG